MNNNLLEHRSGIVHADSYCGLDYTLCGVDASNVLNDGDEYDNDMASSETETEPCMSYTSEKITCPSCASLIRFCCKLGTKSIKEGV